MNASELFVSMAKNELPQRRRRVTTRRQLSFLLRRPDGVPIPVHHEVAWSEEADEDMTLEHECQQRSNPPRVYCHKYPQVNGKTGNFFEGGWGFHGLGGVCV